MGVDPLGPLEAFDIVLIAIALGGAILLSQALLSLMGRVANTGGAARAGWLAVGSLCLGAGLWTADLSGLLALQERPLAYFPMSHALLSAGLAIVGAAVALAAVLIRRRAWVRAAVGGVAAGVLFLGVHLVALAGVVADLVPRAGWRAAVVVAVVSVLAWVALIWLAIAFPLRRDGRVWLWRLATAVTLLAALAVTFYGTMTGGLVRDGPPASRPGRLVFLLTPETILAIAGAVGAALLVAMIAATLDRRVRQKRAETEALRRSEDRFRSLVQASAQIVWTTSPDGQMHGDQSSWSQFTGQKSRDYQGFGWFNAVHPEDRERTASLWEETLANRQSVEIEHRVRRYDGQYRSCVARVVPVLEPDGRVREWVGTHSDVTDRARMQEERDLLVEAGRMLSSSLDDHETLGAVARLIVPRLADWCAIDVRTGDGTLRRLVAAHQDPYRASILREAEPETGRADAAHGIARVLRTGESELIRDMTPAVLDNIAPDPGQAESLRKLGAASILWVPLTARGQVLGVLTLALSGEAEPYEPYDLRDLALAEELAGRAAVAIDNARLYSASQSAIRARDEVLGVVSHDLRNPLGAVTTASDLLLDIDLPPNEQRRHLEIIRRSALSANRLIRDLLDVSQSDNGQLSVDPQAVEAAAIVEEACELMRPLALEKSQQLTCRVADRLPTIFADPDRVQQVLSNLIGNSVKFTPGGGEIAVRATAAPEGVRFSVVDNGPGIPSEDLSRLFDRHWRGRETAHLGAGLGLAISKGIVEAHGGRIWAESAPGSGATFHFVVPAAPAGPLERDGAREQADGSEAEQREPVETSPR